MEAHDVKHGLQNYHKFKEWTRLASLELEAIQHKMEGWGGSIIKKPEGNVDRGKMLINKIAKKDKIKQRQGVYFYYIEIADDFIKSLPKLEKSMIIDKYINGLTEDELEEKYHYSRQHIRRIVDRLIEEYIEQT